MENIFAVGVLTAEDITMIGLFVLSVVVFIIGCWMEHRDHLAWRERMRQRFGNWDE